MSSPLRTMTGATILATPAFAPHSGSTSPAAASTAGIVADLRAASGCAGWKALGTVEIDGTHAGDDLDGPYVQSIDTNDGRSVTHAIGRTFRSADGYDGAIPWSKDFSGGTNAMSAPEAVATARTDAWMNARGWCDPHAAVRYTSEGTLISHGRTLDIVAARPVGGAIITIYVDRASHLIDRTVEQLDENHVNTEYSDWRSIGNTVYPFVSRIDDPEDEDTAIDTVHFLRAVPRLAAVAFARPAPPLDVTFPPGVREVSVPYTIDNCKPIVNVKLNGMGPFPFVVDTGGHFILTAQTAQRLGVTGHGAASSTNGSNVAKVGFTRVARLEIGGVTLANQIGEVHPYGFRIAGRLARGFDDGGRRVSRATISIGPFVRHGEPVAYSSPTMDGFATMNVEAAILSESVIDGFVSTFDYGRGAMWLAPIPGYAARPLIRSGVVASKQRSGVFVVEKIIDRSPAAAADICPKRYGARDQRIACRAFLRRRLLRSERRVQADHLASGRTRIRAPCRDAPVTRFDSGTRNLGRRRPYVLRSD
jgi:Aspartyl protease